MQPQALLPKAAKHAAQQREGSTPGTLALSTQREGPCGFHVAGQEQGRSCPGPGRVVSSPHVHSKMQVDGPMAPRGECFSEGSRRLGGLLIGHKRQPPLRSFQRQGRKNPRLQPE
eukprot:10443839-Alexandrium_andersonii.AAC.1